MVPHTEARPRRRPRTAVTLVELLVTISIIGLLITLLLPAVHLARESARSTQCQNNLRQFGIGMHDHASKHGTYCTGAFDWNRDGCVTEVGWVADLVRAGTPVGEMLCPSNPRQISQTYNDLLDLDTSGFDDCVDRLGSEATTAPDGSPVVNACREIVETPLLPGSEERRLLVEEMIYNKHYNTNYAASWWLVRSGVLLDSSGNLEGRRADCPVSLRSRNATVGPLSQGFADAADAPVCSIPLMGCGASGPPLTGVVGPHTVGELTAKSFSAGPVRRSTLLKIGFPPGTKRTGPKGWWAGWTHDTLQDYRAFAPVHRGACNLLMADGGVRSFVDKNRDGLLNNGFPATSKNVFANDEVELPKQKIFSGWTLRQP